MADRFEYIYGMVTDMMIEQDPNIENAFENGTLCSQLYSDSYAARMRITKALDGTLNGENEDVIIIIRAYEQMQKILCELCYEQGRSDAKNGY